MVNLETVYGIGVTTLIYSCISLASFLTGWLEHEADRGENPIENGRISPVQMVFFLSRWKNQPEKNPSRCEVPFPYDFDPLTTGG